MKASSDNSSLHVVVVGAGIGGLACAIACRRADPPLRVTVLERCREILPIGAGIHIPPNACRVLAGFGLLDKLKASGGYQQDHFRLRRYQDGRTLAEKPLKDRTETQYGAEWIAIHRGDYQNVLLDEAASLGASIVLGAEAVAVHNSIYKQQTIALKDGRRISADVVIGADGLWSNVRESVLGRPFTPLETGDLAYRGTFTRDQLKSQNNSERMDEILNQSDMQVWLGPGKHVAFYPLRDSTEYNLVLIVADDLPSDVRTSPGSLEEMTAHFDGWDPVLTEIISTLDSPLKWKLLHFKELKQWTKGPVALMGDASHPTLPYQGQGAAMAVEDGAVLGLLLSRFQSSNPSSHQASRNIQLASLLRLFEQLRKTRTAVNVQGAVHTRHYYHLSDGDEQRQRDEELAILAARDWKGSCVFNWGDAGYQSSLLGFDAVADADNKYNAWWATIQQQMRGGNL